MKQLCLSLVCFFSLSGFAQQHFEVYFPHNSHSIHAQSAVNLNKWIVDNHEADILKIEAFADTTGTHSYNIDLSKKRAAAVMQRLVVNKMDRRFEIYPHGETNDNSLDSLNRKVVIWYNLPERPAPAPIVARPATRAKSELANRIKAAKKNDRLELKNVGFIGGTTSVRSESREALDDLVEMMQIFPKLKIDIQGHICCARWDEQNLSKRRAKAIYDYLIKNGISAERLSYQGFGGSKPIYTMPEFNDNEREANRRVEIQIIAM